MKTIRSCGAVVFTRENGQLKYLIELYEKQYYGFPKGHLRSDISEKDCVIAEIKKETGLDVVLDSEFVTYDSYPLTFKGLSNVTKTIIYFLAAYKDQMPEALDPEISKIYLMSYDEAIKVLQFESSKRILTEAHEFLLRTTDILKQN